MIATIQNMKACRDAGYGQPGYPRVFAYSPTSGEEYSADPGDYWDNVDLFVLRDSNGKPMELVYRQEVLVEPKIASNI